MPLVKETLQCPDFHLLWPALMLTRTFIDTQKGVSSLQGGGGGGGGELASQRQSHLSIFLGPWHLEIANLCHFKEYLGSKSKVMEISS